jgi:hypothetical protein
MYGVHSDIAWSRDASQRVAMIRALYAVRARVARVELQWEYIEATRGRRDWSIPDHIIRELRAQGIAPLFVVCGSPAWASGTTPAADRLSYLAVPTDTAAFLIWVGRFQDFVKAAAMRYKGQVTLWELGNEENSDAFWRPAVNVQQYARWYVALDSAVHQADPTNQTAVGGLTAIREWYGSDGLGGQEFLQRLFALGLRPSNVAIHPYSNRGQSPAANITRAENFDDIALIHAVLVGNGLPTTRLWATEWGWDSNKVTEATQASYVSASLERLATLYPYVTIATYFSEFDTPAEKTSYGLYHADLTPKPAARAFAAFMAH